MRRKIFRRPFILSVALVCCALGFVFGPGAARFGAGAQTGLPVVSLQPFVSGLSSPIGVTHAGDGSGRVFIIEQGGRIRVVKNGALLPTPFLDISTRISAGGEQGLLGLAFPPDFTSKGYFYVNYTLPNNGASDPGDTVVARFRVNPTNPDLADPNSEQRVLLVVQPFANHNGGHLAFGPADKFLYVALGDGGSGGDPDNRAQNPNELLGKLLRIDVETGRPYAYTTPPSNPFVGQANTRPEIWALGLRNPWRFSFDRSTADLYLGDVGQALFEEIDFQPAASAGGENYGWRIMEGAHCHNPPACNPSGLVLPVWEYNHSGGKCSVTGGYVYRGSAFPRMQGFYFYGDYCSGEIWGLRRNGSTWENTAFLNTSIFIPSFGEDEAGNLYVASHATGQIFQLVDNTTPVTPTPTPQAFVSFGATEFSVGEQDGFRDVNVVRTGNLQTEFTVGYRTLGGAASERSDYTTAAGNLRFGPGETQKSFSVLVTNDDTNEANEQLGLALDLGAQVGVSLASPSTANVTILDDDPATAPGNPIDRSSFFVRQHYFDFLNRFPDAEGEAFWTANIELCNTDDFCRDQKREETSAAFFLSIEFQETGYLAYRTHKVAFGDLPGRPVPIRFEDFVPEQQQLGKDVIVGVDGWQARLESNKRDYFNQFVTRPAFLSLYPTGQTPADYVNALNQNAGGVLTQAERDDLAARLADGRETRATALRRVAENETLKTNEIRPAFVLMQYFGYLRRNPDDPPDANYDGFLHWLGKLNEFNGDFHHAQMVKSFIVSFEYRERFGL